MGGWRKASFFISADVLQRNTNSILMWRFMMVYRPAAHARTMKFLGKLEGEVAAYWLPTVVGGNFNLVLRAEDKATTMSIGLGVPIQ
jgi:hypothetical protein